MRLIISKNYDPTFTENVYKMSTDMLSVKTTHLFIAGNKWESITLDLEDTIPEGYLAFLHLVSDDIKVSLPEAVTEKTIHLLSELYPDRKGKLRKQFLLKQPITEVLSGCLV